MIVSTTSFERLRREPRLTVANLKLRVLHLSLDDGRTLPRGKNNIPIVHRIRSRCPNPVNAVFCTRVNKHKHS